ncbi:MAG: hypothetical protein HY074_20370, partial [Deltaproteobacteria bacterium]|nr:hypothetical protein [Deltaproteobacteria bacterium]
AGFEPQSTDQLRKALLEDDSDTALIAAMTPDHLIAPIYGDYLAAAARPLTLVLAHGYAVYAGELTHFSPGHEAALLAPKAIGPKLAAAHANAYPNPHHLVAAFHASPARAQQVTQLGLALGFSVDNLVPATFEQEAIGDLISEQTLLCGGIFSLLEWTMNEMTRAGVPARLIHEECLTELELVAGLLRERGMAATFSAISQAAQCGTISMNEQFIKAGLPQLITQQAQGVVAKTFVDYMRRPEWKTKAEALKERLARLEKKS